MDHQCLDLLASQVQTNWKASHLTDLVLPWRPLACASGCLWASQEAVAESMKEPAGSTMLLMTLGGLAGSMTRRSPLLLLVRPAPTSRALLSQRRHLEQAECPCSYPSLVLVSFDAMTRLSESWAFVLHHVQPRMKQPLPLSLPPLAVELMSWKQLR